MSSTLDAQTSVAQNTAAATQGSAGSVAYYYFGFGTTTSADGVTFINNSPGSNGPHGDVPIAGSPVNQLVSAMASYAPVSSSSASPTVVAQEPAVSLCLSTGTH